MADTKISGATLTTAAATDLVPIARPADTTARHVTITSLVQAVAASTLATGAVELATNAEVITGASSTLAVTPAGVSAAMLSNNVTNELQFDWYIDSVGGNDSNAGTSISAPYKTIAALTSISAGDRIGLKRGSHWREQLTVSAANVTVAAYGVGERPLLDASSILTSASFTKTDGKTNVYQIGAAIASHATMTYVRVWENDLSLDRAASIDACDTTAGTYFPSADNTSPITIYIHPTGNTNPISDGKIYEYNARAYGLYGYDASTIAVYNIHARRNLNDSGSIVLGANCYAYNCLAEDGTKHNFFVRTGAYVENCDAIDAYYGTGSSSLWVYNENTPANENVTFIKCRGICNRYNNYSTGILGHSNISGTFGDVTLKDCIFKNNVVACDLGLGSGYTGSETVLIERCEFYENAIDLSISVPVTYKVFGCKDENIRVCNQFLNTQSTAAGAMIYLYGNQHQFTKCTVNQGIITIIYGVTVDISYCEFRVTSTVANIVVYISSAGAVVDVDHCAFDFPANAESYVYFKDAGTLTSDYNHFFQPTCNFYISAGYDNLAAYQAATGLDANSTSA